jgi:hypothetical protein
MTVAHYEATMTVREARKRYFEVNHFGADGGYNDTWVDFHLGPLPMPFPNTQARRRAVRYHDLHHIVTNYNTDTLGEFEISAWEIGAGCKDFYAAWQLNLGGLFAGAVSAPRRTFRAFVRGLHSQSLYEIADVESLLDKTVADVREMTGADQSPPPAGAREYALFLMACLLGLTVGSLFAVVALPLVPVGLLAGFLRKKQKTQVPEAAE